MELDFVSFNFYTLHVCYLVYVIVALWVGGVQMVLLWFIDNFLLMWGCKYGFNVCGLCTFKLGCNGQDP
jgi:hypothetical protein